MGEIVDFEEAARRRRAAHDGEMTSLRAYADALKELAASLADLGDALCGHAGAVETQERAP